MGEVFAFSTQDLGVFLAEAEEMVASLEENLLALEAAARDASPLDPEAVAEAFRAAHTLKGAAGAVGLRSLAALTHALENVLAGMRSGRVPEPALADALLQGVDWVRDHLAEVSRAIARDGPVALDHLGAASYPRAEELARLFSQEAGGVLLVEVDLDPACLLPAARAYQALLTLGQWAEVISSLPSPEDIEAGKAGHRLIFRIRTEAPAERIRQTLASLSEVSRVTVSAEASSEVPSGASFPNAVPLGGDLAPGEGAPAAAGGPARAGEGGLARSVRVDVRVLDELMNLAGELVIHRARLERMLGESGREEEALGRATEDIGRVATALQERVMQVRMLPVDNLFRRFPRLVRDLAVRAGKEADLLVRGERTELDRAVIEELNDPLLHLLRNAVDHGLEGPAEREAAGKPRVGKIELSAEREQNHVLISVRDDGRGIDLEKVRRRAVALGWVRHDEARALDEEALLEMIFAPGFSTAERVTEISGRGVGLDVVRRNLERLGGSLEVENSPGRGVEFRLRLPLTLAIVRCLLCHWGEEVYALPLGQVEEVAPVRPENLSRAYQQPVLLVRGAALPFCPLSTALGLGGSNGLAAAFAVVVKAGNQKVALGVTALGGNQEVVVKDLGAWLGSLRGVAGATILGDGRVALILDPVTLWRSRRKGGG